MGEQDRDRFRPVAQHVKPGKMTVARSLRRSMTPAEACLWAELRRSLLCGHHFRRQQVIAGFVVDFYCHSASLVVEVDGPIHETTAESDAERDRVLASYGLTVLRLDNRTVLTELSRALDTIRELLAPESP